MKNHEIIISLEKRGLTVTHKEDAIGRMKWTIQSKFTSSYGSNLRDLYNDLIKSEIKSKPKSADPFAGIAENNSFQPL